MRVLDDGRVEVYRAGMAHVRERAADIAEGEGRRIHELSGVEPALRGALIARQLGTLARRARPVGLEVIRAAHRKRNAGLHHTDQIELPAAHDPAQRGIGWIPRLAAPERQLVERARHQSLRYVPRV